MTGRSWKRDEPDSPCKRVCIIHPEAKICLGCFRTAEEIACWSAFAPERRREILDILEEREPLLRRRRGGRARRLSRRRSR